MSSREENVDQFCLITGADKTMAENLLEACGNSLEMALNMHMENGDPGLGGSGSGQGPGGSMSNGAGPSAAAGSSRAPPVLDPEDDVRAPIPQKQETLVDAGYEGYEMNNRINRNRVSRVRSVFDGFRNFEEETRRRENEEVLLEETMPPAYNRSKKRTLEELFKPPLDIMFQGDWQSARDRATDSGRWLLVNIQEPKEFQCQVLNRDLWSNKGVKAIINEHFIFWQQYKQSDEAQRYMTFYKITDWPYIAVIDPRTGENMATWSHIEAGAFPELMTEFLSLHPTLETPEKEPQRKKQKLDTAAIAEMNEEEQLAAAIRASLKETLHNQEKDDEDLIVGLSDDDETELENKQSSIKSQPSERLSAAESSGGEPSKNKSQTVINGHVANGSSATNGTVEASGSTSATGLSIGSSWEDHLGPKDDPPTNILIRYPDGSRDPWNQPATSKLKALLEFISWKGFSLSDHEVVTNFPKRVLSQLDQNLTLKEHNLFPRETIFVQLKD